MPSCWSRIEEWSHDRLGSSPEHGHGAEAQIRTVEVKCGMRRGLCLKEISGVKRSRRSLPRGIIRKTDSEDDGIFRHESPEVRRDDKGRGPSAAILERFEMIWYWTM
jgi:hypothetical protein